MTAREAIDLLTEKNEAGELDDAIAYLEEYADLAEIAVNHRLFVEVSAPGGREAIVQMKLMYADQASGYEGAE